MSLWTSISCIYIYKSEIVCACSVCVFLCMYITLQNYSVNFQSTDSRFEISDIVIWENLFNEFSARNLPVNESNFNDLTFENSTTLLRQFYNRHRNK